MKPVIARTPWVPRAPRPVLVFDLETKRLVPPAEARPKDWKEQLGMSLAVVHSSTRPHWWTFREPKAKELLAFLVSSRFIVGWNLLRFDYQVLARYNDGNAVELRTLDLMQDLEWKIGCRPSLADVAEATLNRRKRGTGENAVELYRQRKWKELEHYCRRDVALTRDLFEFGRDRGYVVIPIDFRPRRVPVTWRALQMT